MSKKNSKNKAGSSTIALNRTARHEYFIEEKRIMKNKHRG